MTLNQVKQYATSKTIPRSQHELQPLQAVKLNSLRQELHIPEPYESRWLNAHMQPPCRYAVVRGNWIVKRRLKAHEGKETGGSQSIDMKQILDLH